MNNSLDKLISNDELLTYICLILGIFNTFLMSIVITGIKHSFSIYIFLLFEALFLIFIVYFILKKKDVYNKDDDIKYDWYFYLRISIITLVFFNFALYIYNISNDSSTNPRKNGGGGERFKNLKTRLSLFSKNIRSTVSNLFSGIKRNNKVVSEPQNNATNMQHEQSVLSEITEPPEPKQSVLSEITEPPEPKQSGLSETISNITSELSELIKKELELNIKLNTKKLNRVSNIAKDTITETQKTNSAYYKDIKRDTGELENIRKNIRRLKRLLEEAKVKRIKELKKIIKLKNEAESEYGNISVSTYLTEEDIKEQKKFQEDMKASERNTKQIISSVRNRSMQKKADAIEAAVGSSIIIDGDVERELQELELALENDAGATNKK